MPKLTKLKLVRLRLGWPLWKVAGQVGVSETLISKWENGEACPQRWLERLAIVYGISPEELKEETPATSGQGR